MPTQVLAPETLQEIYTFALQLARDAGEILLAGVEKRTGDAGARDDAPMEEKMNAVDIVTQTDLGMFSLKLIPWEKGGELNMKRKEKNE